MVDIVLSERPAGERMAEIRVFHKRIESHAVAEKTLPDGPYIGYVLVQMFKLGISLLAKRWPGLA